jgi:hypothetical protein
MTEEEFEPGGWREFIDLAADHSPFTLLTTSIRAPGIEVTDPAVRDIIGEAAEYARSRGIGIVMDLDVRLARRTFEEAHPDQLQEMLRIRELPQGAVDTLRLQPEPLSDHYTFRTTPYVCRGSRLVGALRYRTEGESIVPGSVEEITPECEVLEQSAEALEVRVPREQGTRACVLAAFRHFTPDAFSPEIIPFQRAIIEGYSDLPLAGVCKDEWGFPPCFDGNPAHDDYWYSEAMDDEYRRRTGQGLAETVPLLWRPHAGIEDERAGAINDFSRMVLDRHVEIETAFYEDTKAVFGEEAFVGTHATWYPQPDVREMKKNGLSWWAAPRDYAQTDEITPYCCRTALSKKWGGPWYNMFYAPTLDPYGREVTAAAHAGGRVNFHPPYPRDDWTDARRGIFTEPVLDAMCLHRLLGFITTAPLDCPSAVVFGHEAAMNWTLSTWGDAGQALAEHLWLERIGADLIPTTEIESGSLFVDGDGKARYGPQQYDRIYLLRPQFCGPQVRRFVEKAERAGGTRVTQMGDWTRGPDGRPLPPGQVRLGSRDEGLADLDHPVAAGSVGIPKRTSEWGGSIVLPLWTRTRLLDGTFVFTGGDELYGPLAQGVGADRFAAFRLDAQGEVEALCGRIRWVRAGRLRFRFPEPVDLAIWRDDAGWHGVVQDLEGPLPRPLTRLTDDWTRLATPRSLPLEVPSP